MISREPIQNDEYAIVKPNGAGALQHYAPPKLEKMQKLAQVTGNIVLTGAPV